MVITVQPPRHAGLRQFKKFRNSYLSQNAFNRMINGYQLLIHDRRRLILSYFHTQLAEPNRRLLKWSHRRLSSGKSCPFCSLDTSQEEAMILHLYSSPSRRYSALIPSTSVTN